MKIGPFPAIFLQLHPVALGFLLALAFLLNSVLSNAYLSLTNKLILGAFSGTLVLVIAFFESLEEPARNEKKLQVKK